MEPIFMNIKTRIQDLKNYAQIVDDNNKWWIVKGVDEVIAGPFQCIISKIKSPGIFIAKENGKYGISTVRGEWIIKPEYEKDNYLWIIFRFLLSGYSKSFSVIRERATIYKPYLIKYLFHKS